MVIDPTYLMIIIATTALSAWASWRVKSNFQRYSTVRASSGLTGAQAAARILQASGIRDVQIVPTQGTLSDHYDPMNKRLVLCEENYYGQSVAAVGIAAHEAGHAIQHAKAYAPLHLRMAAVGITTKAGWIVSILGFGGMFLVGAKLALLLFTVSFGVIMLFQLITLPVEFDATARAKRLVGELNLVYPGAEQQGMNKVLDAAALTYVAAFLSALLTFLYHLMHLLNSDRRD
ncbi:MAG: zinc metallopeptidase [Verrucomicrobiaceae bacterium]|nr:zinc metallopeptidase [Verrucomicrobiaceae bacterium]